MSTEPAVPERDQFVDTFGNLFQGPPWIAEQASAAQPFEDVYDLRRAFHDALFEAPPERQLELIRQYPDLAGAATRKETILKSGNARLQNSPAAEQATALVEIAKIANLRLLDIVEEPVDQPAG